MPTTHPAPSRTANRLLWVVQVLLAALFLFAGGFKLVASIAEMTKQLPMPGLFLRFIGVAEVAGALGLILPGVLRIRPVLTPLAAGGLVIIMSGAVGVTMATAGVGQTFVPAVVGILAATVAVGRWWVRTPVGPRRPSRERQVRLEQQVG